MMNAKDDPRDPHKSSNKWLLWLILFGSLGYGGYSAFNAYNSEDLQVEVRPIRRGADPAFAAMVVVTNTGSAQIQLRRISDNGRTTSDCVVETKKALGQGDSFEASPNMLFGFLSPTCGRIQTISVTTAKGPSEFSIRW